MKGTSPEMSAGAAFSPPGADHPVRRHGKQIVHDAGETLRIQAGKIPGKLDGDQLLTLVHAEGKALGVREKIVGGKELHAELLSSAARGRQQGHAGLEHDHAGTFRQPDVYAQSLHGENGLTASFLGFAGAAGRRGVACRQFMQCFAHGVSLCWYQ